LSKLAEKRRLLEDAGYAYNFDRMIYVNRQSKKVFSIEAIEDNDESWLKKCIEEKNEGQQWRFYFNFPPSESVKQELLQKLNS
jgi:hypothetical protein